MNDFFIDDKLHYIGKGRRQLVVRSDEHREKIVSSHHISGETHNGIIATHTKIVAKYYWIAMIADIKQHVRILTIIYNFSVITAPLRIMRQTSMI